MKSEHSIENILQEQVNTYKTLHGILSKERKCLVKIDVDQIEEISKEKDTVIMRLRLLEEERQRLIRKFAEENSVDADIDLRELEKITGNSIFIELRSQLLSLLQSIEEMNKFNSILIDRSIQYIRSSAGFLKSFKTDSMPPHTGVLLSRET